MLLFLRNTNSAGNVEYWLLHARNMLQPRNLPRNHLKTLRIVVGTNGSIIFLFLYKNIVRLKCLTRRYFVPHFIISSPNILAICLVLSTVWESIANYLALQSRSMPKAVSVNWDYKNFGKSALLLMMMFYQNTLKGSITERRATISYPNTILYGDLLVLV